MTIVIWDYEEGFEKIDKLNESVTVLTITDYRGGNTGYLLCGTEKELEKAMADIGGGPVNEHLIGETLIRVLE